MLKATVLPAHTTYPEISWVSSDENVATVSPDGMVKAVKTGTCTVSATNGSNKAVCKVTVNPVEAESIAFNQSQATLKIGEKTMLETTFTPEHTTDKSLTWESSDTSIASISNGIIQAKATGSCIITATTINGRTATCEVITIPNELKIPNKDGATIIYQVSSESDVIVTGAESDQFKTLDLSEPIVFNDLTFAVTEIAERAFLEHPYLESVIIPSTVNQIGLYAFAGCRALTSIMVDETNKTYSSLQGILFDKNQTTLLQYPAAMPAEKYNVPDPVTTIGEAAFMGCTHLSEIMIGLQVSRVMDQAFYGCQSLKIIQCKPTFPPMCDLAFEDIHFQECTLVIPNGSMESYKSADTWKNFKDMQEESVYTSIRQVSDTTEKDKEFYTLNGLHISESDLVKGQIYLLRIGNSTKKILF